MKDNQKSTNDIRVRVAPSPTGSLHIGTARVALFNYLFAKKNNGTFVLRIEDTDTQRSKPEFETEIIEGLSNLGLHWDEIYKQSERTEIYKTYLKNLIKFGFAYESQEEIKEEGQRASVIRFKNPNKIVTFTDLIRGEITFDTTELGDFVIAKSMDEPLYHLAVVLDDHEMRISHIIRGEDHISNTPRQILIQEAIGASLPFYAHLPLVLSKEKRKLSKRDGVTSILEYLNTGYLKPALLNFIAFLGWHPEGDQELFTLEEMCTEFDLFRVQKGGAVFDMDKLNWFNKEYIKKLSDIDFQNLIKKSSDLDITNTLLLTLIKERITTLGDIKPLLQKDGEFGSLLYDIEVDDISKVIWKDSNAIQTKDSLLHSISLLEKIEDNSFTAQSTKNMLWDYATQEGRGAVLWPIRYILSNQQKSPDPFILMEILGKEKSLIRLRNVVNKL